MIRVLVLALLLGGCCFTIPAGPPTTRVVETTSATVDMPRRPPQERPTTTRVQVEVFTDYQCPYCKRHFETMRRLQREHDVDLVIRHNPLRNHPLAPDAARAALAARRQGKEIEMSALLFQSPAHLKPAMFPTLARRLGLDVGRFQRDLTDPALVEQLRQDQTEAARRNARATPTTFVGTTRIVGAKPYDIFVKALEPTR